MSEGIRDLTSPEVFFAHLLGLEHEFAERLGDLSDCLEAHNNPDAARVCSIARMMHERRIANIAKRASRMTLPRIAPWDYVWHNHVNIEALCMASVHYLMTPLEAVELVLAKIDGAHEFYASVAQRFEGNATGESAKAVLLDFEQELQEFRDWAAELTPVKVTEDTDPPNEPL